MLNTSLVRDHCRASPIGHGGRYRLRILRQLEGGIIGDSGREAAARDAGLTRRHADVLPLATINGADHQRRDGKTGSLEVGKEGDQGVFIPTRLALMLTGRRPWRASSGEARTSLGLLLWSRPLSWQWPSCRVFRAALR